jgi:KEOPS complex subunit Pcc1
VTNLLSGHSILRIPLDSEENAKILLKALTPETASVPSDRARVELAVEGSVLVLRINASDLTALRAAMNSYLSWIAACQRTLHMPKSLRHSSEGAL